ncbi:hypothetical protein DV735_g1883, partial [Chaetothyriales sp. CBS 134920]
MSARALTDGGGPFALGQVPLHDADRHAKVIAPARTLKLVSKGSQTAEEASGHAVPKGSHWADITEPGTILVIEQPEEQTCAAVGGIMAQKMKVNGVQACVVGGRVRDQQELKDSQLAIFAAGKSTVGSGAESAVYGHNLPVTIRGVTVKPGDIVFCDPGEGVVVIPQALVDATLQLMPRLVAADDKVKEAVKEGLSVAAAFKKTMDSLSRLDDSPPDNKGKRTQSESGVFSASNRFFKEPAKRARDRALRPFFQQGMLRGFLAQPKTRADGLPVVDSSDLARLNRREIVVDNFDFPELLTSKLFAHDYTHAFYSQNYFEFDDPRAALWFFKAIGPRNLTSLKHVRFNIHGGFDLTAATRTSLTGQSYEELWVNVCNFLKYRHCLRHLAIDVVAMPPQAQLRRDVQSQRLSMEDVEERAIYVARLPAAIQNVRGLETAWLRDTGFEIFRDHASLQRASLLMQQAQLVYDPARDMRNLSLSETLARARFYGTKRRHFGHFL